MSEELEITLRSVRRGTWKWLLSGALLLIVTALAVLLLSDERLRPYEDLLSSEAPVPDALTNGFLFLKQRWEDKPTIGGRELERLTAMQKGTEPMDGAFIDRLRKGRETNREDLSQALAMPVWLVPPLGTGMTMEVAGWITNPLRLFILDAETALKGGDAGPAVSAHRDVARLARRQFESGGGIISLLVAGSIQNLAAELCCDLLDHGHPDEATLKELEEIWRDDPAVAEAGRSALLRENRFFTNALNMMTQGKLTPQMETEFPARKRFLIKRNQTLNIRNDIVRTALRSIFLPFPSKEDAQAAGFGPPVDDRPRLKQILDPNYVGGKLARSGGNQVILNAYRALFVPRAIRVRLAIHRWRQAHPEQWPASLSELVPDYLPQIPKDPWNGNPLLWDQASRIVYATGLDWKPDLPTFNADSRSWFAPLSESPGLRGEMPPERSQSPAPGQPRRRVVLPP